MTKIAFEREVAPTATTSPDEQAFLDIHVSCENVIKLDTFTESDPMCVLFIKEAGAYKEFQRTEIIWNDPNPKWVHFFIAKFVFETVQDIKFGVYDADKEGAPLSECGLVGEYETSMHELVHQQNQTISAELIAPGKTGKRGTIKLAIETHETSANSLQGIIELKGFAKQSVFKHRSPFVEFAKASETGQFLPVFRTPTIKNHTNTTFPPFLIDSGILCNNNMDTPILVSVFNNRSNKNAELVGSLEVPMQQLIDNSDRWLDVKNGSKVVGQLRIRKMRFGVRPTMMDYIRDGMRISLITAIDFTGSNGNPKDSNSLHYIGDPDHPNQYQRSLHAVGQIVCPYDSTQEFPAYFFGGSFGFTTHHCYPLTCEKNKPTVHGLEGIEAAYEHAIRTVGLSGPTNFYDVLRMARKTAESNWKDRIYTILLMLTDGEICDMGATIRQIVKGSREALSVIIIGVGRSSFSSMDELDADETPLVYNGVMMQRDIVQFVPFLEFEARGAEALAAEVLHEVPGQITEFCLSKGYIPAHLQN